MSLKPFNIAAANFDDAPSNYKPSTIVQINKAAGGVATLYADAGGLTQIPQDGSANRTDSSGMFSCWIADGDYTVTISGVTKYFYVGGGAGGGAGAISFDDVGEMVAKSGVSDGDVAYLKRYAVGYDFGEGTFEYRDSYTNNDGGVWFKSASLTGGWLRKIEAGYVTPQMYGARSGDYDTRNDSAAIQAALDSGYSVYIPRGSYRVKSALTMNSNTRLIRGDGAGTRLIPDLVESEAVFNITARSQRLDIESLMIDSPITGSKLITGFIHTNASSQTRGTSFKDIYISEIYRGISLPTTFAKCSIENYNHQFTTLGSSVAGSYGIRAPSNTVFIDKVDIVGGFESGILKTGGTTCSISNFNIAGSTGALMTTAISATNPEILSISNGYIEKLETVSGDPIAISLTNSKGVKINNVNCADGSLLLDGGKDIEIGVINFARTTGGIRTLGHPEYSIKHTEQLNTTSNDSAYYNASARGDLTVIAPTSLLPAKSLNSKEFSLMLTAPAAVNGAVQAGDTTLFLTAGKSIKHTIDADFEGCQFSLSGLSAGQVYTLVAMVRMTSAMDNLSLYTLSGSGDRVGNAPQVNRLSVADRWVKMCLPFTPDSSGNAVVRLTGTRVSGQSTADFWLDSVQTWLGLRYDAPFESPEAVQLEVWSGTISAGFASTIAANSESRVVINTSVPVNFRGTGFVGVVNVNARPNSINFGIHFDDSSNEWKVYAQNTSTASVAVGTRVCKVMIFKM